MSVVASFVRPEADDAEALRARGLTVHQIGPCRDPFSRHPDAANASTTMPKARSTAVGVP